MMARPLDRAQQDTVHTNTPGDPLPISVVVPLYFAEPDSPAVRTQILTFLERFAEPEGVEVLLSDSGPKNREGPVRALVEGAGASHIHYHYEHTDGPPLSRAEAMNLGARRSHSPILLFLHIDCQLPDGAIPAIRAAIRDGARAGGFVKHYSGKRRLSPLHATELYLNRLRTISARRLVGTNAIFVTRELFLTHPYRGDFLEDVELSDWLRRRLPRRALAIIDAPVTVSARKYQKHGPWASIAINGAVMVLYRLFRVRPSLLRRGLYHKRFPSGLPFWIELLRSVLALIPEGGRRHGD